MSEKTEKATPYKLQKAKEKGQVSKSVELNISILLIILLGVGTALWPALMQQLKALLTHILTLATRMSFSVDNVTKLHQFLLSTLVVLWLPFALTAILSLILSTIIQTGFVWSLEAVSPDFKRLNLAQSFKRLFSSKLLFEALKTTLKLGLTFLLLALSLRHEISSLLLLMSVTPMQHPALILNLLFKIMFQLLLLLLALAILDKLYTKWKYGQDQRMSKQDLKDEYRQREGDPKIKSKIRQLQQQLRQKTASLEQVKTADVIVTNPTHLAIALKYEALCPHQK